MRLHLRAEAVALPQLAHLDDARPELLQLGGDDVAVGDGGEPADPAGEPVGGVGVVGAGVDAVGEEVDPVLDVVGEVADLGDPAGGLDVGVLEGLAAEHGGVHGPQLGLEEGDVPAGAGEQLVLLLHQLRQLARQRLHHARQRAHRDLHPAGRLTTEQNRLLWIWICGCRRRRGWAWT
uniref:Predicted protein n=1 Tax=Hordeum vulgare subsp. vulgare TaxID=112509 RepID=F2D9E1_HORVV|nr:predicted protein [Hordeum vulgare subsp. vulgare]BAK01233.1 predicted protein [Hordeum vulgare subsp. vulgare]